MKNIKVLLADDNQRMRESIRRLLELDYSIDIVAEAANGEEVLQQIPVVEPEIVVMDVSMPGMSGIETAQYISLHHPRVSVIMISVNDEIQNFKKAMMAGAKEYLVKPLSHEELNGTVRKVAELNRKGVKLQVPEIELPQNNFHQNNNFHQRGSKLVSIFAPKGGVGKSTISVNLAAAMALKDKKGVALVDLDVQFGDISVMMNVDARKTISELLQEGESPGPELLEDYMYERNGVHILAAPGKPELAELVTPSGIEKILRACRESFDFTFIDTAAFIDENTLSTLEMSDLVLLLVSLDLPTIKNVKKGLEILRTLQLLPRTRLILNRSSGIAGLEPWDIERVLDMKIAAEIPSDGKLVVSSLNQGIPFIKLNPKAAISKAVYKLLQLIEE